MDWVPEKGEMVVDYSFELRGRGASSVAQLVVNLPASVGDAEAVSILGSERSLGGGNGNPLQYFFLENFMDRGAWWATVHGVAKSWTRLSDIHTHTHNIVKGVI